MVKTLLRATTHARRPHPMDTNMDQEACRDRGWTTQGWATLRLSRDTKGLVHMEHETRREPHTRPRPQPGLLHPHRSTLTGDLFLASGRGDAQRSLQEVEGPTCPG